MSCPFSLFSLSQFSFLLYFIYLSHSFLFLFFCFYLLPFTFKTLITSHSNSLFYVQYLFPFCFLLPLILLSLFLILPFILHSTLFFSYLFSFPYMIFHVYFPPIYFASFYSIFSIYLSLILPFTHLFSFPSLHLSFIIFSSSFPPFYLSYSNYFPPLLFCLSYLRLSSFLYLSKFVYSFLCFIFHNYSCLPFSIFIPIYFVLPFTLHFHS